MVCHVLSQPPPKWTLFSDPKYIPQVLLKVTSPTRCLQLAFETYALLARALQNSHSKFQWVPSQCGVSGNELSGAAPKATHATVNLIAIPLAVQDVSYMVRTIGMSIATTLWKASE